MLNSRERVERRLECKRKLEGTKPSDEASGSPSISPTGKQRRTSQQTAVDEAKKARVGLLHLSRKSGPEGLKCLKWLLCAPAQS